MKLNLQLFAKSINDIAKEVIQGKWGNGATRKNKLTAAGYDASAVQNAVNSMMSGSTSKNKTPTTSKTTTKSKTTTPSNTNNNTFKPSTATTTADKNRKTVTTQKPSDFTYSDYSPSKDVTNKKNAVDTLKANKPGDFTYDDYEESDVVKQAKSILQQHINNKPGEYQSNWQGYLDNIISKILNREEFSYDLNGDALYQQYKDQYTLKGLQGMMDTMGQAQAMTGGYGNSYAQSVGQQTYQGYLQQLNDKIPELYQLAYDRYNQEGQDLYNQYGLISNREATDYGRYRDTVSDWQVDRDYYTNRYDVEANTDYNRYIDRRDFAYKQHRDDVADYNTELDRAINDYRYSNDTDYNRYIDRRDFAYKQHRDDVGDWQYDQTRADNEYWNLYSSDYQSYRDEVSDEQWQKSFDEGVRQYNETLKYNKYKASSSGGSGSNKGSSSSGSGSNKGSSSSGSGSNKGSNSSGSGNGSGSYTYKETPNTTNFVAKIRTKQEFLRGSNSDNQAYKTYEDYVKGMLEKYEGDLTDDEIATIIQKFGLK